MYTRENGYPFKTKNHLLSAEIFMKLSFCTTCKGRTFHLKQTLPQNLKVVRQFSEVELIVLNYNSPDDLDEWIRMTFKNDFGYALQYFVCAVPLYFHMTHAKNVAHRLGSGDVLFNLDADNFICTDLVTSLLTMFRDDAKFYVRGYYRGGGAGRIGMRREDFYSIGGYNEELIGWGIDDRELCNRATRDLGLEERSIAEFDSFLNHPNSARIEYLSPQAFEIIGPPELCDDKEQHSWNVYAKSSERLAQSWLRSYRTASENSVKGLAQSRWGIAELEDFRGERISLT